MTFNRPPYRGRFAPSPTGPLHFGSIVTALGSYLHTKSMHGEWLVRIEDIDIPRIQHGAVDDILRTLEKLGLHWDGVLVTQSQRTDIYNSVLRQLTDHELIYACICTRSTTGGHPYAGTCRNGIVAPHKKNTSLRLRVGSGVTGFTDGIQGWFQQCLATDVGDFIVRRADGMHAYHLAVVIDDYLQGITGVMRGADLLDSTPRQIYLQQMLNYYTPAYYHIPVATNSQGLKISKQNHAPRIDHSDGVNVLYKALQFLGQNPIDELLESRVEEIIRWGLTHWNIAGIPKLITIQI